MIVVVFNKPDFEYDVHSLLKEFFPQEDVQMYYSCPPDEVEGKNLACTHHEMTDDGVKEFADASQVFKIDYVGDEIAVEWTLNRAGGNNSMTDEMQQADESDIKTAGESICTKISAKLFCYKKHNLFCLFIILWTNCSCKYGMNTILK